MKTQTFGIEVEMTAITCQRAAEVIAEHFGTTPRHMGGTYDAWEVSDGQDRDWRLVSDSSIAGSRDQQTESVSPICGWQDIETVQALIRKLRAAGAKAHTSCGIHVHVGAGEHTAKTLRNPVNIVNAKEDLLTQALGILPDRRGRWCRAVDADSIRRLNRKKPKTTDEFAAIWYGTDDWRWRSRDHYDGSRYHLLNLHSLWQKARDGHLGAIEFRAFNSTLRTGEIKAYIQLCLAISHRALTAGAASATRPQTDNPKYTFRCWLLRLGFIGNEFKTAREHLIKNLPGNSAWRQPEANRRAS